MRTRGRSRGRGHGRTRGWSHRHHATHRRATLALVVLLALSAKSAHGAVSVAGVGGFDHYAGPGQTTNGAVAALVLGAAGGDLTLAGVRYDNSRVGWGTSLTSSVGVPLVGQTLLRLTGTRMIGDQTFRAWRANVGPQFGLPGGRTLSIAYAYYRDNLATRSNGITTEATTPLGERITAKMSASCARPPEGETAFQGAVGLGVNVSHGFSLSAELGAVRDAVGVIGPSSTGGGSPGGLPLLGGPLGHGSSSGGGGSSSTVVGVERTFLVGVRKTFP